MGVAPASVLASTRPQVIKITNQREERLMVVSRTSTLNRDG